MNEIKQALSFVDSATDGYKPIGPKQQDVVNSFVPPEKLKDRKARTKAEQQVLEDAADLIEINRRNREALFASLGVSDETGYHPAPMGSLDADEPSPDQVRRAKAAAKQREKIEKAKAKESQPKADKAPKDPSRRKRSGWNPTLLAASLERREEAVLLARQILETTRKLDSNAKLVWRALNNCDGFSLRTFAKGTTVTTLAMLRATAATVQSWDDGSATMPEALRVGRNGRMGRIESGLSPELERQRINQRKYRAARALKAKQGGAQA